MDTITDMITDMTMGMITRIEPANAGERTSSA